MGRWIRNIAVIGLIGAFLMPIFGYAVSLVRGADRVSATEKRVLAEMPSLQGDARQFTTDFDQYLNDNFGFRMLMIRVARKIRDNLGENPPSVIVGKEGWLFLGQLNYRDEFEGNGRWDNVDVQRWVDSLSEVNASLARRGIPFAAFVAVDKARVYPENLPDDWEEGDRRFRTELYSHPQAGSTGLVDAEALVLQAKARGKQTFFLRDTHWTSDGTYDLAMAVMDALDPAAVRPRYLPGPPRKWPPERLLDLEAMAGFETSQEPAHLMIDFPRTWEGFMEPISKLPDGSIDPGQFSTIKIEGSRDAPAGRLVIVGDSFADAMVGHFRPSYAEIIRIHHGAHYSTVSLDDVMAYEPDAVLFATAERQAMIKERPFAPLDASASEP